MNFSCLGSHGGCWELIFFKTTCPKSCHVCLHVKASSNRTKQNPPPLHVSLGHHGLIFFLWPKTQQIRGQSSLMNDTNPPQRMHKVYQFTFLKHLLCFCKTDLYRGRFFWGSHSVSDRTLNGSPNPEDVTKYILVVTRRLQPGAQGVDRTYNL